MASTDVNLKLDAEDRIWFAHTPSRAVAFTLFSLGFTWICWHFIDDAPAVRTIFVGFSSLFVLGGLFGIFWRLELDIDLITREVRMLRGMWPAPKTMLRPLDEADGIWLTIEYRSSGSSKNRRRVPWWFVTLKFPDEKKGTRLFSSRSEVAGYRKWEHYARRLEIDAIDATAAEPVRKDWQKLDESIIVQSKEENEPVSRVPSPPPGSTIDFIWDAGGKEILLPAPGFNSGLVFLLVFGGVFTVMGGSFLLARLGFLDIPVNGSELSQLIIPPIFMLVGLGIMWIGFRGSFSARVVGVSNNEIYTETLAFGRRSGKQFIPIGEIESIDVGGDVQARHRSGGSINIGGFSARGSKHRARKNEIIIRSDHKILRFGGDLPEKDRQWLADACRFAAVEGQLP